MEKFLVSKHYKRGMSAAISIFVFLIVWQLGVMFSDLKTVMPTPVIVLSKFFKSFFRPIGHHTMFGHMYWSLMRVVPFYALGSAAGIILGITMGWYRKVESIFRPIFEVIRPIPPIAWIPISIVWFGIGEGSKWFLIFLASFITITMNAYGGAKNVDDTLIKCAKMLGANDRQIFTSIVLPSSVPYIFAGLQVALASSWATVVAAEMIRSAEGVGWIIISSNDTNNTAQMLVGIVAIGIIGFTLATVMRGVEDKLCRWNKREI